LVESRTVVLDNVPDAVPHSTCDVAGSSVCHTITAAFEEITGVAIFEISGALTSRVVENV
jgi:hypothetical protein